MEIQFIQIYSVPPPELEMLYYKPIANCFGIGPGMFSEPKNASRQIKCVSENSFCVTEKSFIILCLKNVSFYLR